MNDALIWILSLISLGVIWYVLFGWKKFKEVYEK